MQYSRREVIRLAAQALPVAGLLKTPLLALGADPPAKISSVYGGVQVGVIAPYSFRGMGTNPEDLLKAIVKLGLSAVELQSEGFEPWAGAPGGNPGGRGGPGGRGAPPGTGGATGFSSNIPGLTEAQQSAVREVKELLQLLKREKYSFTATIELEYRTPEGSDTMTELAKCVQFCKDALA